MGTRLEHITSQGEQRTQEVQAFWRNVEGARKRAIEGYATPEDVLNLTRASGFLNSKRNLLTSQAEELAQQRARQWEASPILASAFGGILYISQNEHLVAQRAEVSRRLGRINRALSRTKGITG